MQTIQISQDTSETSWLELNQRLAALERLAAECEKRVAESEKRLAAEHQRRVHAETLYLTGAALSSSLNYEDVLDRILEQAKQLIPHDAASIMLIKGQVARTFRWRGYTQFGLKGENVPLSLNIASTPTLRVMQETTRPLVVPFVETDDTWVRNPEADWIKSYLGTPLLVQSKVIGFLNLNSVTPGFFGENHLEALQLFARQAALALENARLHDEGRQEVIQRVRALREERNFISAVLDTAGALVMVLNRYGRIIRFNRACEQTTGYSFAEVKGKYWWDLFLPSEMVDAVKADFEGLGREHSSTRSESDWITKDGQRRLIAWSNTVLFDSQGAIEYILNTGIDLTERKQAEEALASSEERFREVIRSISDHVYVTEATEAGDHLNHYLSPHIELLTGYSEEKFANDWSFWPSQVIHPDDRTAAANQARRLAAGQNCEMEYRLVKANDEVIWVRDSARVQSRDTSRIVYGVVSDITARKQAEEVLKTTNQQLQALTDRLQQELILAQKIQQSLLPHDHPVWSGLDLACYNAPAREVGGDFYAYHAFESKDAIPRFAIAVGDVSGKGMPAALLMAASFTVLQSTMLQANAPRDLLNKLDLALEPYTKTTHQNCALCYAEIIARPPRARGTVPEIIMRVANAGCIVPLICRAQNGVEWADISGLPLGVGLGAQSGYTEARIKLSQGDLVIFTSDGVVEATNAQGKLFGFERLEQAVAIGPKTSAAAMLTYLKTEVATFTGQIEPRDDLTILVLRV